MGTNYQKSFSQHGVIFSKISDEQISGKCPFCRKESHFYAHPKTGLWDCKAEGISGNFTQFLERKMRKNQRSLIGKILKKLCENRGLNSVTFRKFEVGWDGSYYTIPTRIAETLVDLRRSIPGKKTYATTGSKLGFIGKDSGKEEIWICEGEWDAMALSEIANSASIVGVPGAGSFPRSCESLFQNRNVFIAFDNDDAGISGSEMVSERLQGFAKTILVVKWPDKYPQGFDIRDLYNEEGNRAFSLLQKFTKTRKEKKKKRKKLTGTGISSQKTIENFTKWLYLENQNSIHIMFGAAFANRLDGDPLWMFFIAPPGGSKSELLMSFEGAPCMMSTTSLTPASLISGKNTIGGRDPSWIPKLNGKVLIIKDFTTVLNMNPIAREEIMGILRDAYDGKIEKFFGNGLHRKYKSRFGLLAGVTPVIESYSAQGAALGERFLHYRIRTLGTINVGSKAIKQALKNVDSESKMREDLRNTSYEVLNKEVEKIPTISEEYYQKLITLAQWTAALRGVVARDRYSGEVLFQPTIEVGTRLAKQLCKLGLGIAIFREKTNIDEDILNLLFQVAKDTVPGRQEKLVKTLYLHFGKDYVTTSEIAKHIRLPQNTILKLLEDCDLLHIVNKDPNSSRSYKWRLSNSLRKMMDDLNIYKRDRLWQQKEEN